MVLPVFHHERFDFAFGILIAFDWHARQKGFLVVALGCWSARCCSLPPPVKSIKTSFARHYFQAPFFIIHLLFRDFDRPEAGKIHICLTVLAPDLARSIPFTPRISQIDFIGVVPICLVPDGNTFPAL